jgi:hypothetical protein
MDLCIIPRTNLFPTSQTKINHLLLQDRKLVQFETQNDLQCREIGGRGWRLGSKLPAKLKNSYARFCGGWGLGGGVPGSGGEGKYTKFVGTFSYVLLTVHLHIIVWIKTNLMHNLFLVYFVNLCMFRAYLGPSSGGTTVCIQQLVIIILFRWMSIVVVGLEQSNHDNRQSYKKNNKYQLLYTYGCTSWWWAYIRPKHVEVDEIY